MNRVARARVPYDATKKMKAMGLWPGWLGAVVLWAVVYAPPSIAFNSLVATLGNVTVQVGALLASLPGLALVGLVAPLTGHRRRSAFVAIVPIWGWGRVVEIGYNLATLVQTRAGSVVEANEVDQAGLDRMHRGTSELRVSP